MSRGFGAGAAAQLHGVQRVVPRQYLCTAQTVIRVHGSGANGVAKVLTAGAQVDFDEVIGVGPDGPVTLEQALGKHARTFFTPAVPPASAPMAQDSED